MSRWVLGAIVTAFAMCATLIGGAVSAQEYKIRDGDTLRIEVLEDPSLNRSVLVAPGGQITFPLAGSVAASGRTIAAVRQALTSSLASNFATQPNVYVALESRKAPVRSSSSGGRTIDIYIVGEAGKPGELSVQPGTTVLQAFGMMGGFTKFAAVKRVQLHRAGTVVNVNYRAIERGTSGQGVMTLQDGDVIVVPQRRLFE